MRQLEPGRSRLTLGVVLALGSGCGDDGAVSGTDEGMGSTSATTSVDDATLDPAASTSTGGIDPSASGTGAETSGSFTTDAPSDPSSGTTVDATAESSSTGEVGNGPPDIPMFTELAQLSGVGYIQGNLNTAPNCLIDQIGPGTGGFCTPERQIAGAAVGDVDGDGWDDLFVTRTAETDILFHNNGDGSFTDASEAAGIDLVANGSGAAFADVDNDGDLDLYVASIASYRYFLWINDGTGVFTEDAVARNAAIETTEIHVGMSVGVGDYDLDGYVDLYVSEWRTVAALGDVPSHSRLLRNLGADSPGYFEDTTELAGVNVDAVWEEVNNMTPGTYSFAPAFTDLDGDGYPELSVVSDFSTSRLFWNNGDGTFTDVTIAAGVGTDENGMGSTFGDYDHDGDLDWYITSITKDDIPPQNRLYANGGMNLFTDVAIALDVGDNGWGWGALFFDANNDGDLDLAAANAYYFTAHQNESIRLFSNEGAVPFIDISTEAGMGGPRQRRGVLSFDYDKDGDLDMFVTSNCGSAELYRNDNGNQGDWLRVRTVGTTTNKEGLGARVTLRAFAAAPTQLREIGAAGHFMGQSERVAHFGLGLGDDPVEEVRVYWPMTGQEQVFVDVPRNSELFVEEP